MTLRLFVCLLAFFFAASVTAPAGDFSCATERAAIGGHVPSDTGLGGAQTAGFGAGAAGRADYLLHDGIQTHQRNGAPVAQSLGINPRLFRVTISGLIAKLKASSGNMLVIGHSNTLPQIISALSLFSGYGGRIRADNLFSLSERPPRLIRCTIVRRVDRSANGEGLCARWAVALIIRAQALLAATISAQRSWSALRARLLAAQRKPRRARGRPAAGCRRR